MIRESDHGRPEPSRTAQEDNTSSREQGSSSRRLSASTKPTPFQRSDLPMTVRQAAEFLGVSPQTVYLWVERKQIPHLRVMGRNIRFLKSDLEPFRATFKQEVGIGKTE